ncbi:MAG: PAS domain S-box protein [Cyclobacteriaceae bacterium]
MNTKTLLKKSHHKELFSYMTLDGNFSYVIEKPASNIVYFHALGSLDRYSFRSLCKRIFTERKSVKISQFYIIANVENLKNIKDNALDSIVNLMNWLDGNVSFSLIFIGTHQQLSVLDKMKLRTILLSYELSIEDALKKINSITQSSDPFNINSVVSELLSAKKLLNLSESANYSSLIEHTQDIICLIDKNYRIQITNAAFEEFINKNFSLSPNTGTSFLSVLEAIEIPNGEEYFFRVLKGERFNFTYSLPKPKGNIYYEVSLNPVYRTENEISGVSFFMHDITKLKKIEESLKKSQQLVASINANIKEGIYRSNEESKIIYVNPAFIEMFGYSSEEEIFNTPFSELYADPAERDRLIANIKSNNKISNKEVKFKRKDGSVFWGLISSIRSLDDEGVEFYDGAIRNITRIKETEDKLKKQNLELKKVNRELDRFVYSASHDLRAPLSSILGLIGVARLENNLDARNYCLQLMEKSVLKLDNFIKDIINYSRNKRLLISRDQINFQGLINDILKELQYIKKSSRIEKIVEVNNDEIFISDERRLKIVLHNIISNAIIYSATIREPWLKIEVIVKHGKANITIKDNGQGIALEHQDRIFDMFYRASEEQAGAGLGLYIAKETIEQLNGKINIFSSVGEGTTAIITLPSLG